MGQEMGNLGSREAVPHLLGTRDQFRGRQFFHRVGCGGVGMVWGDSSALHLFCTLCLLLHQLHLRLGIRYWRLGTPALGLPEH